MRAPLALVVLVLALVAAMPAQAQDVGPVTVDAGAEGAVWAVVVMDSAAVLMQTPFGGGAECAAFIVGVNPDHTPPKVVANPDWMCIEGTLERLLGDSAFRYLPFPA